MSSTSSPVSVSVNDSNCNTSSSSSSHVQKPLELKFYYSATVSSVQILTISIGVIGITGNLFALIVFLLHKPLLKRPANYFLVGQCSINLLVSVMLILMSMVDGNHWSPSMIVPMCYMWNSRAIFSGLFLSSVYNIALMTVERYLEIAHPIKHRLMISKGKVIAGVIAGTLMAVITKACMAYSAVKIIDGICTIGNYPTIAATRMAVIANFTFEYFIPIIIFAFSYASMARSLRHLSRATRPATEVGAASQAIDPKISRARRNIIKMLFIVVLAFVICATFKHFLLLANLFGDAGVNLSGVVFNVAQVLSYVNCCNDPFIYGFYYEEFRAGIRKLFSRFQVKSSTPSSTRTSNE